jgi:hypothetical protein
MKRTSTPLCQPPNLHAVSREVAACAPVVQGRLAVVCLAGAAGGVGEGADYGDGAEVLSCYHTCGGRCADGESEEEGGRGEGEVHCGG